VSVLQVPPHFEYVCVLSVSVFEIGPYFNCAFFHPLPFNASADSTTEIADTTTETEPVAANTNSTTGVVVDASVFDANELLKAFPHERAAKTQDVTACQKKLALQMLSKLNLDFLTPENRSRQLPHAITYVIDRVVDHCQCGFTPVPKIVEELKKAWIDYHEITPLLFELAHHGNHYATAWVIKGLVKAHQDRKMRKDAAKKVWPPPYPTHRALNPHPVPVLTERHKPQCLKAFPSGKSSYSKDELRRQRNLVTTNFDVWGIRFTNAVQKAIHRNAAIEYVLHKARLHAQVTKECSAQGICAVIWNSLLDWEDVKDSLVEDPVFTMGNLPTVEEIDRRLEERNKAFASNHLTDHHIQVGLQFAEDAYPKTDQTDLDDANKQATKPPPPPSKDLDDAKKQAMKPPPPPSIFLEEANKEAVNPLPPNDFTLPPQGSSSASSGASGSSDSETVLQETEEQTSTEPTDQPGNDVDNLLQTSCSADAKTTDDYFMQALGLGSSSPDDSGLLQNLQVQTSFPKPAAEEDSPLAGVEFQEFGEVAQKTQDHAMTTDVKKTATDAAAHMPSQSGTAEPEESVSYFFAFYLCFGCVTLNRI